MSVSQGSQLVTSKACLMVGAEVAGTNLGQCPNLMASLG